MNGAAHGRKEAAPKLLTKVSNSGIIYIERKKRVISRRQRQVVKTPAGRFLICGAVRVCKPTVFESRGAGAIRIRVVSLRVIDLATLKN